MPTLVHDFEGFKTSTEAVTAHAVGTARELGLATGPEDRMELLQSHSKTAVHVASWAGSCSWRRYCGG